MNEPRALPPRKRRREAISCEPCRRMKIKCDQNSPCNQCSLRSRIELCKYSNSSIIPPSNPLPSRNILTPTSTASTPKVPASSTSPAAEPPGIVPTRAFDGTTSHTGATTGIQAILFDEEDDETAANTLASPAKSHHSSNYHAQTEATNPRINETYIGQSPLVSSAIREQEAQVKVTFSKTRLFGQSHWMNCVHQFDTMISLRKSIRRDKDSAPYQLHKECKTLARQAKAQMIAFQLIQSNLHSYIPARELCDQLVESYLRTFESVFRTVHIPSFRREYSDYWVDPQSANTTFIIQLLLVMAAGAGLCEDPSTTLSLRSSARQWMAAGQAWLSLPCEKSRLTIRGVQIHCLLLLARQINSVDGELTWISAGSLLRTAMQMGLHWDPSRLPKMTPLQTEIRRRLWATILEIQVQTCMDAGGPPLISSRNFDCQPPSNINDDQLDEMTRDPPTVKPPEEITQTSLQILLLDTLEIRLRIAEMLNNIKTEASYDDTLRISKELTTAFRTYAPRLQQLRRTKAHRGDFPIKLLELCTYRFLFALHNPWAINANSNPTYYYSRKVCLDTALLLLSQTPPELFNGSKWNQDDYACVQVHGDGLFRGAFIQAAVTLTLELFNQIREDLDPFHPSPAKEARRRLLQTLQKYAEMLVCRIKAGETNVQGLVFLGGVVAQAEAMEAGLEPEPAMMSAMTNYLELCRDILKTRVDATAAQQQIGPIESGQPFGLANLIEEHNSAGNPEEAGWLYTDWMQVDGLPWE